MKRKLKVTYFFELLVSLIQSGYPLSSALRVFLQKEETKVFAENILKGIEKGETVSKALCCVSKKLTEYETLIDAAEESGDIEPALSCISEELKEKEEVFGILISSALYPLGVCMLAFVLSAGMIRFALPYINLIADLDYGMGLRVIGAANLWLIVFASGMFFGMWKYLHKNDFQYRVFLNLYYLNKSGVGMEDAFGVLLRERSFRNKDLRLISEMLYGLREGKSFYTLCEQMKCFDIYTTAWLYVTEESGEVSKGFLKVYENYRNKKKKAREGTEKIMEPLLLSAAGIYVLILICGCVIPVFLSLGSKII